MSFLLFPLRVLWPSCSPWSSSLIQWFSTFWKHKNYKVQVDETIFAQLLILSRFYILFLYCLFSCLPYLLRLLEGKEPENTTSLFFDSPLVFHLQTVCVLLLLGWGVDWFSCYRILTLGSLLCFLYVAGVRCSTSIVPFSSCQPPSQTWKLILLLHAKIPFPEIFVLSLEISSSSCASWEDLIPSFISFAVLRTG